MQPPYSSPNGTVIGFASRWTRNASTCSGSRAFQRNRDSTYSRAQITLPSSASSTAGSVIVATPTTSAQPFDRGSPRSGGAAASVASIQRAVRGLHQLGPLVLDRRVEPQPRGLKREVPALFAEPALADVEDLLALEEGLDDDRPFLECGDLECG